MKKGTKDFFKLLGIFAFIGLFAFFIFVKVTLAPKPKYGSGDDPPEWLPSSASDINYMERKGFGAARIAVFSIDQDAFEAFAKENGWPLEEQADVSVFFEAYTQETPPDIDSLSLDEYNDRFSVDDALFYEKRGDNGGGVTIVYDIENHRGYYHYSQF